MQPKPGRIACIVPFCRRTGEDEGGVTEIICSKHWRPVNRTLRRRYRKVFRKLEPYFDREPESLPIDLQDDVRRDWQRAETMWAELKRQAIERAMGI